MRPFSPVSLAVSALVLFGLMGCSGQGAGSFSNDGGTGADATSDQGAPFSQADAQGDGGSGGFGDGSVGSDGGASCNNPLDRRGCRCQPGSAPRQCYTGAASQAGIGSCTYGTQACMGQSEMGGTWGACAGSGAPTTCAATNSQCGTISDGCGGVLNCGTCPNGEICSSRGGGMPGNVCGTAPCVPNTCAALGDNCGSVPDGCGGTLNCGSCPAGKTCGGGGLPNQCGCTPTTCGALGDDCGTVPDGCGGTLNCGTCPSGLTCGGGGVPNQCGCIPNFCLPNQCGTIPDGCGGFLDCGSCPSGQTCGGGGFPNQCGCTPTTCAALNDNCGTVSDGCGGKLNCGTCSPPNTCGGGGVPNQCGCTPLTCQPSQCGAVPDGCGGTLDCGVGMLPPECNGVQNADCDDFPEDCDELCCPCKPGTCPVCPNPGEVSCNGVCINVVNDPQHCGACDGVCATGQICVAGVCQ